MCRVYKLNGMQTQSELIEAIADAVLEKLLPLLNQIDIKTDVGVLVGTPQIARYMGLKSNYLPSGNTVGVHSSTLKRWYNELGFPMCKNPRGRWWIMKSAVDRWMFERGMLMRKLKQLGYKCVSGIGRGGFTSDAPPERYKAEEIAHATREIIKDRTRKALATAPPCGEDD